MRTPETAFAELVALAGFDFAWIDMEHTALGFKEVESLIVALQAHDCISLVRVPRNDPNEIGKALDMGANIVDVPQVETVREAQAVIASAKYSPLGLRGFASSTRSNKFGIEPLNRAAMPARNADNMVMVQIESVKGLRNAGKIALVDGIDILFLGPGDLSQDLGVAGELAHPQFVRSVSQFAKAVNPTGKVAATAVTDPVRLNDYMKQGFRMFACGVDTILMKDVLVKLRADIRLQTRP